MNRARLITLEELQTRRQELRISIFDLGRAVGKSGSWVREVEYARIGTNQAARRQLLAAMWRIQLQRLEPLAASLNVDVDFTQLLQGPIANTLTETVSSADK